MIEHILQTITTWIQHIGPWGVFVASIVEELVSLIPSSMVQLAGGFFLVDAPFWTQSFFEQVSFGVALPAALGVAVGSVPLYMIGYWGGEYAVVKWGKWFAMTPQDLQDLRARLTSSTRDDVVFVCLRALPLIPSIVLSVGAGVLRMPWRGYVLLTTVGVFARAFGLALIGAHMGQAYANASSTIEAFERIGVVVLIISIAFFALKWYRAKKKRT